MANIQSYEDLKNNENIKRDENLKILIKEIDEIKDNTTKDDDKIEGIFNEKTAEKSLTQGLLESLNNQDVNVVKILIGEVQKIIKSENIDEENLNSVKELLRLLTEILNKKNEEIKESKDISRSIEGIGKIENGNFVFDNKIREGYDEQGQFATIGGQKYYEYKDNMNGLGYIYYGTGFYMGNFIDGNYGKGTYYFSDGSKFEGELNGIGKGIYTRPNGTIIEGNFKNGIVMDGTVTINVNGNIQNYKTKRDFKGIKIISNGDNEGKYIDDETGEITNIPKFTKDLTPIQIQNIEKLYNLGIIIHHTDFEKVENISENQMKIIEYLSKLGIEINLENIEEYSKLDKNELEILKIDSKNFYEGYNYTSEEIESHHHYKRGRIIENIQTYVQNIINENRDIGKAEIIEKVRADLITLPIKEKLDIIIGIHKIVEKFNTVRKFLNFETGPYKNPKQLLCAIRGITDQNIISHITNNITVRQHGSGFMFFVEDEKSFQIINDRSLTDSGEYAGGRNYTQSEIPELKGTLSLVNGKDPGSNAESYEYGTIRHEGQHNRNTYFMPDKDQGPITYAKDEITAYLRDGRGIEEIKETLTEPESEGGLYQYDLRGENRENHKNQVRRLLSYASDLIELTKDPSIGISREKIISMLSDTPQEKREELHSNIMNAVKSNEPLPDKFWRTGTAEKQTEINEINLANSIQEIKHILNNPKYSHISWIPNNKGGIEISAMIDEVVAGKLDISYIPIEIRQQVQKFINQ